MCALLYTSSRRINILEEGNDGIPEVFEFVNPGSVNTRLCFSRDNFETDRFLYIAIIRRAKWAEHVLETNGIVSANFAAYYSYIGQVAEAMRPLWSGPKLSVCCNLRPNGQLEALQCVSKGEIKQAVHLLCDDSPCRYALTDCEILHTLLIRARYLWSCNRGNLLLCYPYYRNLSHALNALMTSNCQVSDQLEFY